MKPSHHRCQTDSGCPDDDDDNDDDDNDDDDNDDDDDEKEKSIIIPKTIQNHYQDLCLLD
jgi:hypothetical protein